MAAVRWRRSALVRVGGLCFAAGLALAAGAPSLWLLLPAFALLYPASGAFVSLSQATLMDVEPARRELNMARWVFAGAVGALAGPLFLGAFAATGHGWRTLFVGFAAITLGLLLVTWRMPLTSGGDAERPRVREALRAVASREVFRWLFLVELSNLLLDVFLAFLALYFVDELGASPATGGLAVAVWTGAGLAGSAAMIPLLRHRDGLRYLRLSAAAAGLLFAAFLLVPSLPVKLALVAAIALVNAGWYPILQARLYAALGDASSLALTVGALFPLNTVLPLAIAGLASRFGLSVALWPLVTAPVALLLLVPRSRG